MSNASARLADKAALITGAASGIGRSMARRFAAEGARLVLADRDEKRLAKVLNELTEKGATVQSAVVDLSDSAACAAMVNQCVEAYGGIDILCNNAGVLDNLTPCHDTNDEMFELVMSVNVNAPFAAIRAALPHMLEKESGAIVNTSSAAGAHGGRGGCAYTTSKHAVIGLTRSVAWFYGGKGIRCNAIAPGSIQTRMAATLIPHPEGMAAYQPHFPTIPRFGKAMEVAEAALFLASDAAAYVNGAVLAVDGGWTAY